MTSVEDENGFIMTLDSDDELGSGGEEDEQDDAQQLDRILVRQDQDEEQGGEDGGSANLTKSQAEKDQNEFGLGLPGKKGKPARLADREKVTADTNSNKKRKRSDGKEFQETAAKTAVELNPEFQFDLTGDGYRFATARESASGNWDMSIGKSRARGSGLGNPNGGAIDAEQDGVIALSVDEIIERRRQKRKDHRLPLLLPDEADPDGDEAAQDSAAEDQEDDEDDEMDGFGAGLKKGQATAADDSQEEADESDEEEEENSGQEGSGEDEEDPLSNSDEDEDAETAQEEEEDDSSDDGEEKETAMSKARKAAFFQTEEEAVQTTSSSKDQDSLPTFDSFQSLDLSRPILRALATLSFNRPTPIQARTIPLALAGKDLVAGAVTGSGKTAAFMIPVLERLSHLHLHSHNDARSRVLILTPTRELAIQCQSVGKALAKFTEIRFCLCVGGLSLKQQESELSLRPEIIIATPGRLIDHVRNTASFTLDDIEVLVMDEADRMLEDGFQDELNEIIRHCPQPVASGSARSGKASASGRQTMLFSATMTDDVDELVRLSLRRPVRLFVDPKRTTAAKLIQEFVRVRGSGNSLVAKRTHEEEKLRPALLLALCTRTFQHQVIIFVRSKKLAHQLRVIFGLLGLRAAELHGDLSQDQRLSSLQGFKEGKSDFLLATDLASRGLDIRGVETVINYDMPGQFEQYLHRVGRTARAGRNGRAVTLVGEADRKMLKTALRKSNPDQVKHRLIPQQVVSQALETLEQLTEEVEEVLQDEKEEKAMKQAEMELKKGQNINEHSEEIYSRPARTWFQSEKDKQQSKFVGTAANNAKVKAGTEPAAKRTGKDRFDGLSRKKKRSKMMREEIEAEGGMKGVEAAVRSAKRDQRPKELGIPEPKKSQKNKGKDKKKRSSASSKVTLPKTKSGFRSDLGERGSGGGGGARKAPGSKNSKSNGPKKSVKGRR